MPLTPTGFVNNQRKATKDARQGGGGSREGRDVDVSWKGGRYERVGGEGGLHYLE